MFDIPLNSIFLYREKIEMTGFTLFVAFCSFSVRSKSNQKLYNSLNLVFKNF